MAIAKFYLLRNVIANTKLLAQCCRCRLFSTAALQRASHYDALGITPKATQSDIKSAYYKLSKVYHPDISNDETSAKKFRAITEAYKVLGNIKLKNMYDRGLIVGKENTSRMEYNPDPAPTDPTLKFYKSRMDRNITRVHGSSAAYDFDTWSKQHYGDLFNQKQAEKVMTQKKRQKQADLQEANRQEAIMYFLFALTAIFALLAANGTSEYDIPKTRKEQSYDLSNENNNDDSVKTR